MSIKIGNLKQPIRKKDNIVQIGSESQETKVAGTLSVGGPIVIKDPIPNIDFSNGQKSKHLVIGPNGISFESFTPQTICILDTTSGVDNFYIQSTRGFSKADTWVLNPGSTTMESGKVLFKLESRLFISGSGINSGLYYEHNKGEQLINISYAL